MSNLKSFLKTLFLKCFGILGIKLLIKGKLFKKRRKKVFFFKKGSISLISLKKDIKFTNFNIFTRAGVFSFKC